MIDEEKLARIKTGAVAGYEPDFSDLDETQLYALRDAIEAALPERLLSGLNLETELVEQYRTVKKLQTDVLVDDEVPANQRAQVATAVANTLQKLIDLQVDMNRDETLKVMEATLIDVIKTLPEKTKNEFFAEYERRAMKLGLM